MVLSRGYPTEFASYFHNYSSLQFDYLKKTLRISSSVKVFSLTMAPVLACLLPSKTLIGNRAERMEGKVGGLLQILLEREFRASCYFWYFIKAKNPVTNEPTISKEVLLSGSNLPWSSGSSRRPAISSGRDTGIAGTDADMPNPHIDQTRSILQNICQPKNLSCNIIRAEDTFFQEHLQEPRICHERHRGPAGQQKREEPMITQ
ncbi:hypothetical protein MLD38_007888 [Melastoma candidum]|uniref:Uncharacterized protein n=1 Tax=Melastoma candidum TaxID=119954 RepID=A0ACB9RVL9_9MYRT|nr:hypothetical protein MLD38_007888 [Melastoma candidum]